MTKEKPLVKLISAEEMAKLTGIAQDHLEHIKYLTPVERRQYQEWLRANVEKIAEWTGIAPDHVQVAVHLRSEPSVADFPLCVMQEDLEPWKILTDEDGGDSARLIRLRDALRTARDILSASLVDSDCDDLLGQALAYFTPKNNNLGQ